MVPLLYPPMIAGHDGPRIKAVVTVKAIGRPATRWFLNGALPALAIGLATLLATPATAAPSVRIAIPAATLDVALTLLARESGQDIISTEPALHSVHTRALSASVPVATALVRLLEGSGYHAVAIDARSWRIVRDAVVRAPPPPAPRPAPPPPPPAALQGDIVVTASKQRIPLLRYPGTLTTISANGSPDIPTLPDMTDVARATPVLQNTEFGPGRNKIFIRGIADSSFDGATQSTASIYLGDVQLGYAGADPSLKLYDMQGVQVMEGPQGTLYGSGVDRRYRPPAAQSRHAGPRQRCAIRGDHLHRRWRGGVRRGGNAGPARGRRPAGPARGRL